MLVILNQGFNYLCSRSLPSPNMLGTFVSNLLSHSVDSVGAQPFPSTQWWCCLYCAHLTVFLSILLPYLHKCRFILLILILNVTANLVFHHLNDVVPFVHPSGSPSSVMLISPTLHNSFIAIFTLPVSSYLVLNDQLLTSVGS